MFTRQNPKALNLDGLDKITQKVTVGFKCDPKTKLALARQAEKVGLTLSEFTENLIGNLENIRKTHEQELDELNSKLRFYENDTLLGLFRKYKGQTVKFMSPDGAEFQVDIKVPKDIYTILINSFKETE